MEFIKIVLRTFVFFIVKLVIIKLFKLDKTM